MTPTFLRSPALLLVAAALAFSSTAPAQEITTFAGSGMDGAIEPSEPAAEANFESPAALGMIFNSAIVGDRYRIRAMGGESVNVRAGTGVAGYSGDGGDPVAAQIGEPGGIALISGPEIAGLTYFTDPLANRLRVIDANNVLHTFAGDGTAADTGDGGPVADAQLDAPRELAMQGRALYVTTRHRVRRIARDGTYYSRPGGTITTYAGTGVAGFSGDGGPARAARLNAPGAIALASDGTLYIADVGNHRIRKVTPDGIISTVAGTGAAGGAGLGGPALQAQLSDVTGLAVDQQDRLYIAQGPRHQVLRINSDGRLVRFAGTGVAGFSGDGGQAVAAQLSSPMGIGFDSANRLWIVDRDNRRIRRVAATYPEGATVPSAPAAPEAQSANNAARVTVQPPHDGGSAILEYVYQAAPSVGPAVSVAYPAWTVGGLTNGQTYTFTVRARNAVGLGPASPASNPVIPLGADIRLTAADAEVVEGAQGASTQLTFTLALSQPAVVPVTFDVWTADRAANAGTDYVALPRTAKRIEVGQTSTTVQVTVLGDNVQELDETFDLVLADNLSGAYRELPQGTGGVRPWRATIRDDDARAADFATRDDRLVVRENSPATIVPILDNDEIDRGRLAGGSLVLVQSPVRGVASIDNRGTPASVSDDRLVYTPLTDNAGEDLLSYQLCASDGACREAVLSIVVRPSLALNPENDSASGFIDHPLQGLRAMPSARFQASPLVAPVTVVETLAADPTTQSPWDNAAGRRVVARTLAPHGDAGNRTWKILAEAGDSTGPVIDLYLGVDLDNDGQASENEVRCVAATVADIERCELSISQPPGEERRYWVMAHNRGIPAAPLRLDVYEVPLVPTDGTLVATGPGSVPAGEAFNVRIAWNDPTQLLGEYRVGYISVAAGPGPEQGMANFPVRLKRKATQDEAIVLDSGVPRSLSLLPGARHDAVIFDVPLGATRMTVRSTSAQNVDLYLTPWVSSGTQDVAKSSVVPVPSAPLHAAIGASGNETLVIQGAALAPGRWYIVPRNAGATRADLTLQVDIEANTPAVRPGSYFNANRSGHGLFMYPAGSQWAGLWYTYLEDGTSTWYYLQAEAPGLDGRWASGIFRAAWNGTSNQLTRIGSAFVTPTGADGFEFSYTIDGKTGSEPMAPLGRGCPSLGGLPLDASSHWFNPARAGTGYSVQLFPNYEFHAAFVYDARGVPRFLTAERNGFGGATADLRLDQLAGFCPTCERTQAPQRFDVGVLGRTFGQGRLQSVDLDAVFEAGVPGAWSAAENVQLLGGPGSTQGCAP